jgi:inosine/xanthosine triphosphatase
MIVRIASTRAPKVNGVKKAVIRVFQHFGRDAADAVFESVQADSGVAHTPTTVDELIAGARTRARAVFSPGGGATMLTVGVEGGLFTAGGRVFLQSWACVFDGKEEHFGCSGAIEIPDALSSSVLEDGAELGVVIDAFARRTDVRSHQGTFGILSNDLISREDSFETATVLALIPIVNSSLYHPSLKQI